MGCMLLYSLTHSLANYVPIMTVYLSSLVAMDGACVVVAVSVLSIVHSLQA